MRARLSLVGCCRFILRMLAASPLVVCLRVNGQRLCRQLETCWLETGGAFRSQPLAHLAGVALSQTQCALRDIRVCHILPRDTGDRVADPERQSSCLRECSRRSPAGGQSAHDITSRK